MRKRGTYADELAFFDYSLYFVANQLVDEKSKLAKLFFFHFDLARITTSPTPKPAPDPAADCTFTPKIIKKRGESQNLVQPSAFVSRYFETHHIFFLCFSFSSKGIKKFEMLYKKAEEIELKRKEKLQRQEEDKTKGCTFVPQLVAMKKSRSDGAKVAWIVDFFFCCCFFFFFFSLHEQVNRFELLYSKSKEKKVQPTTEEKEFVTQCTFKPKLVEKKPK
jgi:hypothetical protein